MSILELTRTYMQATFEMMREPDFRELDRRAQIEARKTPGRFVERNNRALIIEARVDQILIDKKA